MPNDSALDALRKTLIEAQGAVAALSHRIDVETDPQKLESLNQQWNKALGLEAAANERLVHAIIAPDAPTIARLGTATAKLKKRIAKFKAQAQQLAELAAALDTVADIVSLIMLA